MLHAPAACVHPPISPRETSVSFRQVFSSLTEVNAQSLSSNTTINVHHFGVGTQLLDNIIANAPPAALRALAYTDILYDTVDYALLRQSMWLRKMSRGV